MNEILDNPAYSLEERLEMAKVLLAMQYKCIANLTKKLDDINTSRGWDYDQNSIHRMGL